MVRYYVTFRVDSMSIRVPPSPCFFTEEEAHDVRDRLIKGGFTVEDVHVVMETIKVIV